MASEQNSNVDMTSEDTGSELPEEQSKPSFLNKVKAKARKLKSKMTHHESPHGQTDSPRSTGEDENEDDTTESDSEGGKKYDIPYTPLSNAHLPQPQRPPGATDPKAEGTPTGAVPPGERAYDPEESTNTDDKSSPVDPAVLRNEGPPGTEQAVPTNYSYFNSDPSTASLPSDHEDSQSQRDVPSAIDEDTAAVTPETEKVSDDSEKSFTAQDGSLSKSRGMDAEASPGFVGSQDAEPRSESLSKSEFMNSESAPGFVDPEQQSDPNLDQTSRPTSQSSFRSDPTEQDRGLESQEPSSLSDMTPHDPGTEFSELADSNAPKQSASDTLPTSDSAADEPNTDRSFTPTEGEGLGQDTTGATEGAEEVDQNTPSEESTWTQKAYGVKDAAANTLGYTGDYPASNDGGEQKPVMDNVTDTASGMKNTVASKLGYADHDMSTDSPSDLQKEMDPPVQGEQYAADEIDSADKGLCSDEQLPVSAKGSETTPQESEPSLQKEVSEPQEKSVEGDSISDSASDLPSMLSSKMDLGEGNTETAASPPTSAAAPEPESDGKDDSDSVTASTPTSNAADSDLSKRKDTPYPDQPATPASPGLFNRVTGIASSLFGGGGK